MKDNKEFLPLEVEKQGDTDKHSKKRITGNLLRPDYFWLEAAIWRVLEAHKEQIIKEITEIISTEDTDRALA